MQKQTLKDTLNTILAERVTDEERALLGELGITTKRLTKSAVIAAALYKKAAAGDLTAIKELRAITSDSQELAHGVVRIIDDIGC